MEYLDLLLLCVGTLATLEAVSSSPQLQSEGVGTLTFTLP